MINNYNVYRFFGMINGLSSGTWILSEIGVKDTGFLVIQIEFLYISISVYRSKSVAEREIF